jgi:hypothetical protein
MLSVQVVCYVIAIILAVPRSLAVCVVGTVAVIRVERDDIPEVVRAMFGCDTTEVDKANPRSRLR